MARALLSAENNLLRNVAGFAVATLVIPIVILVKLISSPFEKQSNDRPPKFLAISVASATARATITTGTTSRAFPSLMPSWKRFARALHRSTCHLAQKSSTAFGR